MSVTLDDVRALALSLPRSYEAVVRGRVKFRVGQIVYLAFSQDRETMGFGFPKELRDALVQSSRTSSRCQVVGHALQLGARAVGAIGPTRCVTSSSAWAMCVPKRVAAEYAASQGYGSNAETPRRLASSSDRVGTRPRSVALL